MGAREQEEPTTLGGDRVIRPNFRFGDQLVRAIGVVAHFRSPRDVTPAELRIWLMYPADEEAEASFRGAAPGS